MARTGKIFSWLGLMVEVALLVFILTHLTACTTVTPERVTAAAASYDGNAQTSGFIAAAPGGGYVVTPHLRERYNDLIAYYGRDFRPALAKDDGITPAGDGRNYVLDREHAVKFLEMNQWAKAGLVPVNK
jgi:hypothetical protein